MLIGLLGLMLALYVVLVVADLYLYYRLEKRVSDLEGRMLTQELVEDSEEYDKWTTTLNSHSQSS